MRRYSCAINHIKNCVRFTQKRKSSRYIYLFECVMSGREKQRSFFICYSVYYCLKRRRAIYGIFKSFGRKYSFFRNVRYSQFLVDFFVKRRSYNFILNGVFTCFGKFTVNNACVAYTVSFIAFVYFTDRIRGFFKIVFLIKL